MARPQKEGLDYFPHDTDAVNDEKIEALRALYGNNGYAFYFIHLERIYRNPLFELDISDAETKQILCKKCGINTEEYEAILKTAIKHGCFDKEVFSKRGVLTSNGIKKRASVVIEKRDKMRLAYESKKQKISDAETREETTPETPQSKVKKSKVKKSINNIIVHRPKPTFTPPTVDEVKAYCTERHNKVDAENFVDHYATNGWFRGKTKIKDWKACVRTWEKGQQNKPPGNVPQAHNFKQRPIEKVKYDI